LSRRARTTEVGTATVAIHAIGVEARTASTKATRATETTMEATTMATRSLELDQRVISTMGSLGLTLLAQVKVRTGSALEASANNRSNLASITDDAFMHSRLTILLRLLSSIMLLIISLRVGVGVSKREATATMEATKATATESEAWERAGTTGTTTRTAKSKWSLAREGHSEWSSMLLLRMLRMMRRHEGEREALRTIEATIASSREEAGKQRQQGSEAKDVTRARAKAELSS